MDSQTAQAIPEKEDLSVPKSQSPSMQSHEDSYAMTSAKNTTKLGVVLAAVAITLTSLALIAIVAIGINGHVNNDKINYQLNRLGNRINELAANITEIREELLSTTTAQNTQLGAQISDLTDSYNGVSSDLIQGQDNVAKLRGELHSMRSVLEHKINEEVSLLEVKQNATNMNLTTAFDQVDDLKIDLNNLTQRINSSVGIYDKCVKEQVSCNIHRENEDRFWRLCSTPFVKKEVEDFYTANIQCHYTSVYKGFHIATSLYKDYGNSIRCRCSVTSPSTKEPTIRRLPTNFGATCYLTALRCPIKQQLFTEGE